MHIRFALIGRTLSALAAIASALMLGVIAAHATGFRLDHDSLQGDVSTLVGGNYRLEGGLGPTLSTLTPDTLPVRSEEDSGGGDTQGGGGAGNDGGGGGGARGNGGKPHGAAPARTEPSQQIPLDEQPAVPADSPPSRSAPAESAPAEHISPEAIASRAEQPNESSSPSSPGRLVCEQEKTIRMPSIGVCVPLPRATDIAGFVFLILLEIALLVRLVWIAHVKRIYRAIPAFLS